MPGLQPPCSPSLPPTLIPLCFDALKWLSLHALCAHPTLTSFFLPTPIPSLPALGTQILCPASTFQSKSRHSCLLKSLKITFLRHLLLDLFIFHTFQPFSFFSVFLHPLSLPLFPRRLLFCVSYSAGPASALSQFALQVLTRSGPQVF